jgi:hypothetical protein
MPVTATPSLRYDLILDGAVRRYHDGREVCCDTAKGEIEYKRRLSIMILRQHNVCAYAPHLLKDATFDHADGRGMGAAHRDDRIVDEEGDPMNSAVCWACNMRKGSVRA